MRNGTDYLTILGMESAWKKRLTAAMKARKYPAKRLSLDAGLNETYIRDMLKEGADPTLTKLLQVFETLRVSPSEILEGTEPAPQSIQVIGYAGGGEEWTPVDQAAQGADYEDTIDIDLSDADPIAIRVRGHSMAPVYRDGDHLVCSRQRGANIENALNRDCVVKTADERCYVKMVAKGAARGTYRLRSYNPAYEDLEDQRLEWAAPVIWIRRS